MYEIKVLSDKEFFEVAKSDPRYEFVDEDNLGFADPQLNKAYVRYVAHPELQKYLINHELEELIEGHSGHEDANGIRHKKFLSNLFSGFKNIIGNLLNPSALAKSLHPLGGLMDLFSPQAPQSPQNQVYTGQSSFPFSSQEQPSGPSGEYSPFNYNNQVFSSSGSGAPTSALSLFSGSGGYTPQTVPDAAQGSYTPSGVGSNKSSEDEGIPEYMKQLKFGRLMF